VNINQEDCINYMFNMLLMNQILKNNITLIIIMVLLLYIKNVNILKHVLKMVLLTMIKY
jgi:hypothetical protein